MRAGAYLDKKGSGNEHIGTVFRLRGSPWASFTDATNGFAGGSTGHAGERPARLGAGASR
jgi:hypothetical protein